MHVSGFGNWKISYHQYHHYHINKIHYPTFRGDQETEPRGPVWSWDHFPQTTSTWPTLGGVSWWAGSRRQSCWVFLHQLFSSGKHASEVDPAGLNPPLISWWVETLILLGASSPTLWGSALTGGWDCLPASHLVSWCQMIGPPTCQCWLMGYGGGVSPPLVEEVKLSSERAGLLPNGWGAGLVPFSSTLLIYKF